MTRIFPTLASLSLLLFAAALMLGLSVGDLYANPRPDETMRWFSRHVLTGVAAALAVVFVECLVVTYFIGTGRWCKEVTETYGLPPEDLAESVRLKRRTFPLCLSGMLAVVAVSALGASSDPGTGRSNTAEMVNYHLAAAFAGLALVAWTYFRAWLNIAANQQVIMRIIAQVQQIRSERGLDNDAGPNRNISTAAGNDSF